MFKETGSRKKIEINATFATEGFPDSGAVSDLPLSGDQPARIKTEIHPEKYIFP